MYYLESSPVNIAMQNSNLYELIIMLS